MIPKYINDWLSIIEQMKNDNTYKPCFGRALMEIINNGDFKFENGFAIIKFDDVSKYMISYYWNQIFYFELKQSSNDNKPPKIYSIVKLMIEEYKRKIKPRPAFPVSFSKKVVEIVGDDYYQKSIYNCSKVIPLDVLERFMNSSDGKKDLYEYDKINKEIYFKKEQIDLLKEYGIIISKLLNYKWAQLLEKYNYSPKIVNKVQSIAENNIKRHSLKKYKDQLLKEFEDGKIKDFYTDEIIDIKDVSVDHVIPWSFMYSDDIWNLVITSKSYNSKKSNTILNNEEILNKLKERNKNIISKVDPEFRLDLEEADKDSLLEKYFYRCRL